MTAQAARAMDEKTECGYPLYWEKGKKEQVPAHAVFVYYCV